MASSKNIKKNLVTAMLALLIAFVAASVATFAWYIYNTNAHTTNVHMVAGAGVQPVVWPRNSAGTASFASWIP